jgi:hypothetical protein
MVNSTTASVVVINTFRVWCLQATSVGLGHSHVAEETMAVSIQTWTYEKRAIGR